MTHLRLVTDLRRFEPGDMVLILAAPAIAPDEPDITTLGLVNREPAHAMCTSCHCQPANPEHADDASQCCPGPWYMVTFTCDRSCSWKGRHEHVMTFAEHELRPAAEAVGSPCTGCETPLPDDYRDDFCPACQKTAASAF